MPEQDARRRAKQAYKEQASRGGLYRIKNTATGWESVLLATVNLAGQKNKLHFAQKTGTVFTGIPEEAWKSQPCEAFAFVEVEALEQKPDQTVKEFREDLAALLELWIEGGE